MSEPGATAAAASAAAHLQLAVAFSLLLFPLLLSALLAPILRATQHAPYPRSAPLVLASLAVLGLAGVCGLAGLAGGRASAATLGGVLLVLAQLSRESPPASRTRDRCALGPAVPSQRELIQTLHAASRRPPPPGHTRIVREITTRQASRRAPVRAPRCLYVPELWFHLHGVDLVPQNSAASVLHIVQVATPTNDDRSIVVPALRTVAHVLFDLAVGAVLARDVSLALIELSSLPSNVASTSMVLKTGNSADSLTSRRERGLRLSRRTEG